MFTVGHTLIQCCSILPHSKHYKHLFQIRKRSSAHALLFDLNIVQGVFHHVLVDLFHHVLVDLFHHVLVDLFYHVLVDRIITSSYIASIYLSYLVL